MTRLGAGRLGTGLADQGLASGTSFLLAVLVARRATPEELGAFALAWGGYWICLGLGRALVCEPLLIRYTGLEHARWRVVTASGAGAALWLGAGLAVGCAIVGLALPRSLGAWLLVLAAVLPGLLVQDVWRAAFYARASPRRALANDGIWLALFAGGIALVEADVLSGPLAAFAAWGAAGCAAAVAGAWQTRAFPVLRPPLRWWRRTKSLAGRLAVEFATLGLAGQLALYAVIAAGGLAAGGALRGAQSLLGVVNVLFAGLLYTLVPHGASLARSSPRAVHDLSRRVAAACGLGALALGLGLSLLPAKAGETLLGATWSSAQNVLVPLAVSLGFAGVVFGATAGLRSLGDASSSLRARLTVAPLTVAGAAAGAAFGAREAAIGLAAAGLLAAMIWWRFLTRAVTTSERAARSSRQSEPRRRYGRQPADRAAGVATAD
jgi:hypothetical protein